MDQNQTQQNKPTSQKQREQNQKNSSRQNSAVSSTEKLAVSELLAAAEAFIAGVPGRNAEKAASFLGNQAALELITSGSESRQSILGYAAILGGKESAPEFNDHAPENIIAAEPAFEAAGVPEFFGDGVPAADLSSVAALSLSYLN